MFTKEKQIFHSNGLNHCFARSLARSPWRDDGVWSTSRRSQTRHREDVSRCNAGLELRRLPAELVVKARNSSCPGGCRGLLSGAPSFVRVSCVPRLLPVRLWSTGQRMRWWLLARLRSFGGDSSRWVWFLVIRGLCQSDDVIFFQISAKPTGRLGSEG